MTTYISSEAQKIMDEYMDNEVKRTFIEIKNHKTFHSYFYIQLFKLFVNKILYAHGIGILYKKKSAAYHL